MSRYPVLPNTLEQYNSFKDDGRRYRVLSDAVGFHAKDAILSAKDFGMGADLNFLVERGAVVEVPSDTGQASDAPLPFFPADDPTITEAAESVVTVDAKPDQKGSRHQK